MKTAKSDLTLIAGGRILDVAGNLDQPPLADILIESGRIAAVSPQGSFAKADVKNVIDARGMLVTPGFVNAHYHSHDVMLRGMFEQVPLEIWGLYSFPSSYTRRSSEEIRNRTLLGAVENLRSGVTTVQDMVSIVGPDREHVDSLIAAYEEAGIRAVVALQFADKAIADSVPYWRTGLSEPTLSLLGTDVDPKPMQEFIASLLGRKSPRLNWALGPSAPQRCSEEFLSWVGRMAEQHDLRIFTHVYETRSQAVLARTSYKGDRSSLIALLKRLGLLTERLSIAHGVWISEDEIGELAAGGTKLICNPVSNLKLLSGVAPVRAYAEAGVSIALGCDNCSGNDAQNIFEAMKTFALLWGLQGAEGEAGAARKAFEASTLGGAKALGLEREIGAIRAGFRADLVLIDLSDPSFVPLNSAVKQLVYACTPRAIRTVLVEGVPVVIGGKLSNIDENLLHQQATRLHADLCVECEKIRVRFAPVVHEIFELRKNIECFPVGLDRFHLKA